MRLATDMTAARGQQYWKNGVQRLQKRLVARLRLAKAGLCLPLGFSALFGYLLAKPELSCEAFLTVVGVFFLAAGGATLNSLQDWRQDCLMARTRNRPLPRGELTERQAIIQAAVLTGLGLSVLAVGLSPWPMFLGLVALLLYNGVYSILKRRTVFAIFPGAACGALPTIIGWMAAGGRPFSTTSAMLFLLLILWQIPHFWLVMLHYREDYSTCTFPNMLHEFSEQGLKRLLIPWIAALAVAMILITLLPLGLGSVEQALVVAATFLMLIVFFVQLGLSHRANYRLLFIVLNGIFFFNMLVIGSSRVFLFAATGP